MRLAARRDKWGDRECAICSDPIIGEIKKQEWGCRPGDNSAPIDLGHGEDLVVRCPLALFREHPADAEIAAWASHAFRAYESGNFAWFMRDAYLTARGQAALDLFTESQADRVKAEIEASRG